MARPVHRLTAVVVVGASVTLAGCSFSVGTDEEKTAEATGVELAISTELARKSGVPPASVECPEEMVQEEGSQYECTVVHPQEGPFVVDVTMKDGGGFTWLTRPQGQ